jgi:hypothetical protein
MAYADPQSTHNPATGTVAPATWGDAVRDALEYLARNKPHCHVYNASSISLTSGVATALTFDTERVDVGGLHSTAVNTGRITIPAGEGGFYLIGGTCEFASNATGIRGLDIRLNGATYIARTKNLASSGGAHYAEVATLYQLAATDYVELVASQTSGGALNAVASGNYSPEFYAIWMAV